jgi:hypothetical protein
VEALVLLLVLQQASGEPAEPPRSVPCRDLFGVSIDRAGDLDGDGVDDLALGGASIRCDSCQGSVLVVTGRELRPLRRIVGAELRR